MSNKRHQRRPRTIKSTNRFNRGSRRRHCRSLITKVWLNSSYQQLHPITSHLPNSYSISRMNNQVNRRTAHLQSSSSHLKARHLSNFHKSIRSYNTLRSAILDYGINILHLRAPSRHHRWLSQRISEEKKKSTRCERSIVSSTHKALI